MGQVDGGGAARRGSWSGCPKRQVETAAAGALAGLRAELERAFGWTALAVRVSADPRRRALAASGEAVTSRARAAAVAAMTGALPPGWWVDARGVGLLAPRGLFAPPPGLVRLWRTPRGPAALCTELAPGDGPLALLATRGASCLVRAADGTVGWLRGGLGPRLRAADGGWLRGGPGPRVRAREVADRTWPIRHDPEALSRALRGLVGAPYRPGGTTAAGLDCSGLVQRAVRALGVVLPRHSTDQLALAAAPARALGEPGDLVFLWGAGEAPCHVGVVLRGARPGERTLVHASSRRGVVIEEPLAAALARAAVVRHVELEQVLGVRR